MLYEADIFLPNLTVLLGLEIREGSMVKRRDLALLERREVSGVTAKIDLVLDLGDLGTIRGVGEEGSMARESRFSVRRDWERRDWRRGGDTKVSDAAAKVVVGLGLVCLAARRGERRTAMVSLTGKSCEGRGMGGAPAFKHAMIEMGFRCACCKDVLT